MFPKKPQTKPNNNREKKNPTTNNTNKQTNQTHSKHLSWILVMKKYTVFR